MSWAASGWLRDDPFGAVLAGCIALAGVHSPIEAPASAAIARRRADGENGLCVILSNINLLVWTIPGLHAQHKSKHGLEAFVLMNSCAVS